MAMNISLSSIRLPALSHESVGRISGGLKAFLLDRIAIKLQYATILPALSGGTGSTRTHIRSAGRRETPPLEDSMKEFSRDDPRKRVVGTTGQVERATWSVLPYQRSNTSSSYQQGAPASHGSL